MIKVVEKMRSMDDEQKDGFRDRARRAMALVVTIIDILAGADLSHRTQLFLQINPPRVLFPGGAIEDDDGGDDV